MSQEIQAQLEAALNNSKVFQLLDAGAQKAFRQNLLNCNDDQARQAMDVLQKHELELQQMEEQRAQNLAQAVAELSQEIKAADKLILKQDEQDDQAKELEKLASLEESIAQIDTANSP